MLPGEWSTTFVSPETFKIMFQMHEDRKAVRKAAGELRRERVDGSFLRLRFQGKIERAWFNP